MAKRKRWGMTKKRIRLVGEKWDRNNNSDLKEAFGNHEVGDIIEVELKSNSNFFIYNNETVRT